jgi:hypothetical protein
MTINIEQSKYKCFTGYCGYNKYFIHLQRKHVMVG